MQDLESGSSVIKSYLCQLLVMLFFFTQYHFANLYNGLNHACGVLNCFNEDQFISVQIDKQIDIL